MARRGGIEKVIRAVAKEAARQQRLSAQDARRRQRAYEKSVRDAERADDRAYREMERAQRQAERDGVRSARDAAKREKDEAKREQMRYLASRELEARQLTEDAEARVQELSEILHDTLSVDDTISFDSLRITDLPPQLRHTPTLLEPRKEPDQRRYFTGIVPPNWLLRLVPGRKKKFRLMMERAQAEFELASEAWKDQETERQEKLAGERLEFELNSHAFDVKKKQRDEEVNAFREDYISGDPEAIVAYVSMVLERSVYPDDFPQHVSVAYAASSKQIVVELELPDATVIPSGQEFRYIKSRDLIEEKPRKVAEIKSIYQDVIASIALRTIHEIFESDQGSHVEACCFNGYVHTVDPATGTDTQPHLISVRATKEIFGQINLARVDRQVCLRNLGAQVSRHATEAVPVRPIVDFNMTDVRFVDQTDLISGLDASTNLMDLNPFEFEQLVANLFAQMGLESKLTRSSRDGGVDCIAFDPRPVLGGKVVIQAKRYKHTVGVSAVRDLYGTMMNEGANKGILVTTSGYGPDAFQFSKEKPIELIDGGALLYLLQDIGIKARIIFPED